MHFVRCLISFVAIKLFKNWRLWVEIPVGDYPVLHVWDFPGEAVVRNLLPMKGTLVRSLVQEDLTCCRATKPRVPQLLSLCSRAHEPQLLKPACLESVLHNKRSHHDEKPRHRNEE